MQAQLRAGAPLRGAAAAPPPPPLRAPVAAALRRSAPPAAAALPRRRPAATAATAATAGAAEMLGESSASGDGAPQALPDLRHREYVMRESASFLAADLDKLFRTGEITLSRYAKDIKFRDPVTKYDDLEGYLFMISTLRTLFNVGFQLHKCEVTGDATVTASWTMSMEFWLAPWKPVLTFTGRSIYGVDPDTGVVLSHTDEWDALARNSFPSMEGYQHVLKQFLDFQMTPALQGPTYQVLRKTAAYEVRRYEGYTVAEAPMAPGSGPAGSSGFTDLAGYIFGANKDGVNMEMTTPVLTALAPGASGRMQFVMERRFAGNAELLPEPRSRAWSAAPRRATSAPPSSSPAGRWTTKSCARRRRCGRRCWRMS